MKRRALLARSFLGIVSAGVFSAAGWLMGTRSLTMPDWVWQNIGNCTQGSADCDCLHSTGSDCNVDTSCAPGGGQYGTRCRALDYMYIACCADYPTTLCKLGTRTHPCGSCAGCE